VDGRRGAGGRPADGAQAAWPRSASVQGAPAWERGAVVLGRLGRPCGRAMVHWTRPIALDAGSARERARAWAGRRRTGRPLACSGLQDRRCAGRPVHCLYRRSRQRDGEGQRGQREDDRAAPYGVGQGRTYGGAAFDGLGMRATWGRGKLRWEGTRGPRKAHERLGCGGGRHWDAAGARRRARAGAHSRQKFIRSTPI
jgi:hypothetical protein